MHKNIYLKREIKKEKFKNKIIKTIILVKHVLKSTVQYSKKNASKLLYAKKYLFFNLQNNYCLCLNF